MRSHDALYADGAAVGSAGYSAYAVEIVPRAACLHKDIFDQLGQGRVQGIRGMLPAGPTLVCVSCSVPCHCLGQGSCLSTKHDCGSASVSGHPLHKHLPAPFARSL